MSTLYRARLAWLLVIFAYLIALAVFVGPFGVLVLPVLLWVGWRFATLSRASLDSWRVTTELRRAYLAADRPRCGAYLLAVPGPFMAGRYLRVAIQKTQKALADQRADTTSIRERSESFIQTVAELEHDLNRARTLKEKVTLTSLGFGTILSAFIGGRMEKGIRLSLILAADVTEPIGLLEFAVRHATVSVRSPDMSDPLFRRVDPEIDQNASAIELGAQYWPAQIITALNGMFVRDAAPRRKIWGLEPLMRILRRRAVRVATRRAEVDLAFFASLGHTVIVFVGGKDLVGTVIADDVRRDLYGYKLLSGPSMGVGWFVAEMLETVAAALPLRRLESRLERRHWVTANQLGRSGLPPLADCYLRFRLAKSDVERFLALLDCLEIVAKYSVFVMRESGFAESQGLWSQLERPAFGTWISLMGQCCRVGQQSGTLAGSIAGFWLSPVAFSPEPLLAASAQVKLNWRGKRPQTNLDFLAWVVWLRNVTKGHGVVDELQIARLWSELYVAFLEVASGLAPLTLDASLENGEQSDRLSGWLRGGARWPAGAGRSAKPWQEVWLRCESERILLSPFAHVEGARCYTWNAASGDSISYVEYGTGAIRSLSLETEPD